MRLFAVAYLFFQFSFFLCAEKQVSIAPRMTQMKKFPCSECHKKSFGKKVMVGEDHDNIVTKHMPEVRSCYLCHSRSDPDKLNLLEGQKISYDDSYLLCSECHGLKKRDWDMGLHGTQKGGWIGLNVRYACTQCHDPHYPKFPKYLAKPPPQRPSQRRHVPQEKGAH